MPPLPLTIHLFGPLRVLVHGELMPRARGRSIEWLLALLTLRNGRTLDRAWLAGILWPDSEESQALHNLRDALVHLRRAFGPERDRFLSPTRDTLTLDLQGAEVDVLRFDRAIERGDEESLRAAVELYTAPLLEGCFEEWVLPERTSREQAFLRALEILSAAAESRGELAEALSLLRRAASTEALRDTTQRALMRVLAASGDVPAAVHAYREYRVRLRDEMNVEPDDETIRLYQQISANGLKGHRGVREQNRLNAQLPHSRSVTSTPLFPESASPPPPRTDPFRPHANASALPYPITALLGREEEIREVNDALTRSRLVTLTGGGGVGKTRLAIEIAAQVTEASEEEVAFVALASLTDPDKLPLYVAETLGLRDEGSVGSEIAIQAVTNHLSQRRTLLVLDNCEHLIVATATLTQSLLGRCRTLRVLTTSRQRLGLTGEIVWRVRPLALPESSADRDAILRSPAVQLFTERAAMARPELSVESPDNTSLVARICHRLEGIPLAIELAAARVGALDLDQIAARLDDRFRLLTGGSPAVLPRHQTLRALIDWSYDLLNEEEMRLLRALSVFPGGWALEAAEAVTSQFRVPSSERTEADFESRGPEISSLDLLTSLADKSLIQLESGRRGVRYRMLETIREYAFDRLQEAGELEAARRGHLSWAIDMATQESVQVFGPFAEPALNRLQIEIENLRAALSFARSDRAPEGSLLQLASCLWLFWEMRGYLSEGLDHLRVALSSCPADRSPFRARALLGAAILAHGLRDYRMSNACARDARDIFRSLGDDPGIAASLLHLGQTHLLGSDVPAARSYLSEALLYCRNAGWSHGTGVVLALDAVAATMNGENEESAELLEKSLQVLETTQDTCTPTYCISFYLGGLTYSLSKLAGARAVLSACLSISRRAGERRGIALSLRALAEVAGLQGDPAFALTYLEEVADLYRGMGNYYAVAYSLQDIGNWHYRLGDYASASIAYSQSLESFRALGYAVGQDTACNNLGSTLFHLGDRKRARQLHREALSHYERTDNREGIAWSLERLAVTEAHDGEPKVAATLFGAAERARTEFGRAQDPWDKADFDDAIGMVGIAIGDSSLFDAAWKEGHEMTKQAVISFALGETWGRGVNEGASSGKQNEDSDGFSSLSHADVRKLQLTDWE